MITARTQSGTFTHLLQCRQQWACCTINYKLILVILVSHLVSCTRETNNEHYQTQLERRWKKYYAELITWLAGPANLPAPRGIICYSGTRGCNTKNLLLYTVLVTFSSSPLFNFWVFTEIFGLQFMTFRSVCSDKVATLIDHVARVTRWP